MSLRCSTILWFQTVLAHLSGLRYLMYVQTPSFFVNYDVTREIYLTLLLPYVLASSKTKKALTILEDDAPLYYFNGEKARFKTNLDY